MLSLEYIFIRLIQTLLEHSQRTKMPIIFYSEKVHFTPRFIFSLIVTVNGSHLLKVPFYKWGVHFQQRSILDSLTMNNRSIKFHGEVWDAANVHIYAIVAGCYKIQRSISRSRYISNQQGYCQSQGWINIFRYRSAFGAFH
jgi:hypothetical protein